MIIDRKNYTGYLWYSNEQKPDILDGQSAWGIEISETTNPFIVEGQLWDEDSQTSVSIKYVDGHYVKSETVLPEDYDLIAYIPRRMPKVERLLFARCWKLSEDELCEGFKARKLDCVLFKGLKMKKE